jgi:hypothetical protein
MRERRRKVDECKKVENIGSINGGTVAREEVEFGKKLCAAETINELVNTGERVSVFLSDPVQAAVVHTHA